MKIRAASFVCRATLISAAFACAAMAAPDPKTACPASTRADAFTPPSPYHKAAFGSFLVGDSQLWTLVRPADFTPQKLVFFTTDKTLDTRQSMAPLTVTAVRLDAQEQPIRNRIAHWSHTDDTDFITTALQGSPAHGCWEITGRLNDHQVKYVLWLGL